MAKRKPKDGYYNLTMIDHRGKQPFTTSLLNVYLGEHAEFLNKLNQDSFISFYFKEERYIVPVNRIYEIQQIQLFVCEKCGNEVNEDDFNINRDCCYKCLNTEDNNYILLDEDLN